MTSRGLNPERLATEAHVDAKTVRDLINCVRWPWPTTLAKIEDALGLDLGDISAIAAGAQPPSEGDPVDAAIEESSLTQSQKLGLRSKYHQMLEENERRRGA